MKIALSVALVAFLGLQSTSAYAIDPTAAINGTVVITTDEGQGSGFFITKTQLLTAAHVVEGQTKVEIKSADGTVVRQGRVTQINSQCDVATIEATSTYDHQLLVKSTKAAAVGDKVFAIGSPISRPVLSEGKVARVFPDSVHTTAPVDFGSSGGPLLNSSGEVVGVVIQKDGSDSAIAVPIAKVNQCLSEEETTAAAAPTVITSSQSTEILSLVFSVLALIISTFALVRGSRRRRPIVLTLPPEEK